MPNVRSKRGLKKQNELSRKRSRIFRKFSVPMSLCLTIVLFSIFEAITIGWSLRFTTIEDMCISALLVHTRSMIVIDARTI